MTTRTVARGGEWLFIGVLAWLAGWSGPATAQTAQMPGVEVLGSPDAQGRVGTAWGDSIPVRKLSMSATVIDAQTLGLWQAARLEDLVGLVPGVVIEPLNAGLSTAIKSRGFAVTRLHRDGLPDIQDKFARDLSTVDRVEFLRGPSALQYGITSPGGVVNYIGKRPSFSARTELITTVGSDDFGRLALDSTGPVGPEDSDWAYRLVAAGQDGRTSWADLPTRRQQALAALTWAYAAGGRLTVDLQEQRNQTPFAFGTVITNAGAPGSPPERATVQFDRLYVVAGGAPASRRYHETSVDWEQSIGESWHLDARYGQAVVTRDEELLGYWTVVSPTELSGYYTKYHDSYVQRGWHLRARTAFATGSFLHTASFGHDRYQQRFHFEGVQNIGGFSLDVANPDFSGVQPTSLAVTRRYNDEHIDEGALWAADRISIDDATHLTLGVRNQQYTIASDRSGAGRRPVGDASASTFHAGISTAVTSQWQAYVALSTGMEPNRGTTRDGDFLPPQQSRQVEGGVNWQLQKASMHAAAYQVDLRNLAMIDPQDRTALVSTGGRRVCGFEWSADIGADAWRVQANANVNRTRQTVKTSATLGDDFVGAPRRTAGLQIQRALNDLLKLESAAWVGLSAVGSRAADAANTVYVAGYARLDAGARIRWPGGHALQVGVRNLANLRYVEAVTAIDDVFQGPLRQAWLSYTLSR